VKQHARDFARPITRAERGFAERRSSGTTSRRELAHQVTDVEIHRTDPFSAQRFPRPIR
jgi:hypothetical protein